MQATSSTGRALPTTLRHPELAEQRYGELAPTYFAAMWDGDPLADAFVDDVVRIGHGKAMRMLRTACRQGIDAVPDAPESLRALFAQLDATPEWVDLDAIDRAAVHLGRYTRQAGIVLGAASLVSGYANSAASRPLEMTGRYIENAGMRTVEVASWLVAANRQGGLRRYEEGFELTVRVRVIHALVRHSLLREQKWDLAAWGVPICQSYLAYTLIEFCLIPLRGMRAIGAPYRPHEQAAYYARWRYLGHLLGIEESLLPTGEAEQEALEGIYLLTRPPVEEYCRELVGAINSEFLVPEIEQITPARLHPLAPRVVAAMERVFIGDAIADELGIAETRLKHVVRALGPALGAVNAALDRVPLTLGPRTRQGERYREAQDVRLRTRYAVQHDLVDASPGGGMAHPARG